MKSIEDLEQMNIPQLKSIASQLGIGVKAKTPKADLVMMVYNIQQPEAVEEETEETEPAKDKPINTKELVQADIARLEEFFGGKLEKCGETEDGELIFNITHNDREITRGTLKELSKAFTEGDKIIEEQVQHIADPSLPALQNGDVLPGIQEALDALSLYGLSYNIDGSCISMKVGSSEVCTTLNQPAHRVVRTAEALCNR
jgi:hypothetical protein